MPFTLGRGMDKDDTCVGTGSLSREVSQNGRGCASKMKAPSSAGRRTDLAPTHHRADNLLTANHLREQEAPAAVGPPLSRSQVKLAGCFWQMYCE